MSRRRVALPLLVLAAHLTVASATAAPMLTGLGVDNIQAYDISADGSLGVGRYDSNNEAFRCTAEEGMVGLGDLGGGIFYSHSRAVSAEPGGRRVTRDSLLTPRTKSGALA